RVKRRPRWCLATCTGSRCASARPTSWRSCGRSLRKTRSGSRGCDRRASSGRS
ncbi:hypothetical protein H4R20_006770, partial [Coemansia guatemalensis]